MRVLIAGSRTYYDYEEFRDIMNYILKNKTNIELVSGGAKGADKLAEHYAKEKNLPIKIFPAYWDYYGNRAGFIRNEEMHSYLKEVKERLCICFWDGESKGTKHNFDLCKKFNTELIIYDFKKHSKVEGF
jgi:hypothetical protein